MTLVFLASIFTESLLVLFRPLWNVRYIFVVMTLGLLSFWLSYSAFEGVTILWWLLLTVTIFRALNLFKIAKNKIHPDYLKRVTSRTSLVLCAISAALLPFVNTQTNINWSSFLSALAFAQFIVAALILAVTARNLQKTKHHKNTHFFTDKELPTVTVAIPARNETDDMASCLRSVIANDYPKLEVLVLDDCSQDRTAEVIKDFAHDGVRFIAGEPPEDRWLAKNQAYNSLAQHASGEVILFCGVDVRFGPTAIRSLVTSMLSKKRSMMSVLPFRVGGGVDTSLVQPLRYWWELALPRRLFNRPPVLSTCWLIKRKTLKKLGSFKAVSHNVLPERYFAREVVKQDEYAFIRSDHELDIKTVKPIEEQLKTAIRVKYPALQKRPENVLLIILLQLVFLLLPVIIALSWFWTGSSTASILALLATLLLVTAHYLIMSSSHPLHSTIALFNFPLGVITDMVLYVISMLQYEFGKVEWKGRNICIPAMHVVKKLPKF